MVDFDKPGTACPVGLLEVEPAAFAENASAVRVAKGGELPLAILGVAFVGLMCA